MDQAKVQSLQDLLLKFEGRIGPNSLWQGVIVILIVMVLLQLLGFLLGFLGMIFYLLTIALIYPLFCIYAKRFHDAGKPAIWTLAVLAGMIVAYMILNTLMAPFYMSNAVAAANSGAVYTMTFTALLVGWIITAVVHLAAAFVVNQVLKSDPAPNAYGPPPVDAASPNPLG